MLEYDAWRLFPRKYLAGDHDSCIAVSCARMIRPRKTTSRSSFQVGAFPFIAKKGVIDAVSRLYDLPEIRCSVDDEQYRSLEPEET